MSNIKEYKYKGQHFIKKAIDVLNYAVFTRYNEEGYSSEEMHLASFAQPSDAIKYAKECTKRSTVKFISYVYSQQDTSIVFESERNY